MTLPFNHTTMEKKWRDLRVCALHLENIVSYTVDICRPGLDKTVWQRLHVPNLVSFGISIFLVVDSEH